MPKLERWCGFGKKEKPQVQTRSRFAFAAVDHGGFFVPGAAVLTGKSLRAADLF